MANRAPNKKNEDSLWMTLTLVIISNFASIVKNPSFIMFSIIAIATGTLGIWIDFYPDGITNDTSVASNMNNLSVFTFCIATLGGIGTDYFFEEKYKEVEAKSSQALARHLAFLLWFVCLVLSFFAMKKDGAIWPALLTTLTLWMSININTKKFQHINNDAKNNLIPDYSGNLPADEFEGSGL